MTLHCDHAHISLCAPTIKLTNNRVVISCCLVYLHHLKMGMLSLKLILALSCFSASCLTIGVSDTCSAPAASTVCITGQPGPPGPPGTPSDAVIDQLTIGIVERVRRELDLSCKLGSVRHPATSCKEIHDCDPTASSGYYWVNTTTGLRQVFCSAGKHWDIRNCTHSSIVRTFSSYWASGLLKVNNIIKACYGKPFG